MQRFLKLGLPSPRDETWRYTDLRSLAAQSFVDAQAKRRAADDAARTRSQSLLDGAPRSGGNAAPWSMASVIACRAYLPLTVLKSIA